ncbi:MAG: 50S ribosomal protein L23 [Candidatus Dependentiae bacterium]|nr:50S ribosomal protein L23 [Candidatus Dependentiae bacterium]
MALKLNIYQIILKPIVNSEKAAYMNRDLNKLALSVHPEANKAQVAEALEKVFNVKVKKVNIVVRKGKNRQVQRRTVTGPLTKKAYVTLAEGYSLNFLDQAGTPMASVEERKEA